MNKIIAASFSFLLFINGMLSSAYAETVEPNMQIKLVNYIGNQTQLSIKPNGEYTIDKTDIKLISGKTYTIKYDNENIDLFDGSTLLYKNTEVAMTPINENNYVSINNRNYLGTFRFIIENNKYVRPINSVKMEDYLKGVVPFEMFASWNKEALKSQAVAARTYAYNYLNKTIDDTINYQVYGGYTWNPNATDAVNETYGEVLKSNGVLISAVFSASNGGKTELNYNVWGTSPVSYLKIKDDPFDAKTPWQFTIKKIQFDPTNLLWEQMKESDTVITTNIKTWMLTHGYAGKEIKITGIPVMKFYGVTSGGRVSKGDITVEFITKDKLDNTNKYVPQTLTYTNVAASQIRGMMGVRTMLSYLVTNTMETNDAITISGLGDGHGVGLSQWGAKNRADAGQKYNEILAFYYDGATLVKQYSKVEIESEEIPKIAVLPPSNPAPDTIAPKISSVGVKVDNIKKKATISYSINESSKVTLYIKDKAGHIITYLSKDMVRQAGTVNQEYDLTPLANGTYYAGIITVDNAGNQSSALPSFKVEKPAPKLSSVKASIDNSKNKANISFSINESAKVTITVRDANKKIVTYIQKNATTKAGTVNQSFSTSALKDGNYTVGIEVLNVSNIKSTASAPFTVKKLKTGKTTVTLNLHASTSSKSKAVGVVKKGQSVTILSTTGSWYKVQYGNKIGYVLKTYIK